MAARGRAWDPPATKTGGGNLRGARAHAIDSAATFQAARRCRPGGCCRSGFSRELLTCKRRPRSGGLGPALRSSFSEPRRRSEEHTSELQSLMLISYADFCLKKKTN